MESISMDRKMNAIRLLQFLVHSKRPLMLAEAKEVIATQIKNRLRGFNIKCRLFCETDLLDYYSGLATIVHFIDKELHLAHFSVKEYLFKNINFNFMTTSISITTTCLIYLTDIEGTHEEIKRDFPMVRYAVEFWASYAALAQNSKDIVWKSVKFLKEEVTFQRWDRLYQTNRSWDNNPGPPQASRLYYTCLNGLFTSVGHFISKRADINAQSGFFSNALQAALLNGH